MTLNKEELKSKILYRSSYRGSKEMDILLSSFVRKIINKLNLDELILLNQLLKLDDENLYKLYNNSKTNIKVQDNSIIKMFKEFNIQD